MIRIVVILLSFCSITAYPINSIKCDYRNEFWFEAGNTLTKFGESKSSLKLNDYILSNIRIGYSHKRFSFFLDGMKNGEYYLPMNENKNYKGYVYLRNSTVFNLGLKYRLFF